MLAAHESEGLRQEWGGGMQDQQGGRTAYARARQNESDLQLGCVGGVEKAARMQACLHEARGSKDSREREGNGRMQRRAWARCPCACSHAQPAVTQAETPHRSKQPRVTSARWGAAGTTGKGASRRAWLARVRAAAQGRRGQSRPPPAQRPGPRRSMGPSPFGTQVAAHGLRQGSSKQ